MTQAAVMTVALFLILFALGAGAIALWTDLRIPERRPHDFPSTLLHIVAALLIARFLTPLAMTFFSHLSGTPLGGIFLGALPVCVYCFLAMVWLMRTAQGTLGRSVR